MAIQWDVEVSRRLPVAMSPERAIAVKMPAAISDRLDSLVKRLEYVDRDTGEVKRGTNRKELLAALVYDAPANAKELQKKLERYRGARIASTVLRASKGEQIRLPGHRPGPRPTSAEESP